jgi:type I restriction enzyme M protein
MSARNTVKSIQDIMRKDAGVDGDAQRLSQLCWMFFLKIIDDQDQQMEVMQSTATVRPFPSKFAMAHWAANPEGVTGEELLEFVNGDLFPTLKDLPASGKWANRARVVRRRVRRRLQLHEGSASLMRQVVNKISERRFQQPGRAPALRRHLRAVAQRPAEARATRASTTRRAL